MISLQVEWALTLSKKRELYQSVPGQKWDHTKEFSEANWGVCARKQYEQVEGILDAQWDCIVYDAQALLASDEDILVAGGEAGTASSEAGDDDEICFDWWVLHCFYPAATDLQTEPPSDFDSSSSNLCNLLSVQCIYICDSKLNLILIVYYEC